MEKDIVIIGGGMGGLFAGAFLAKEGRKVVVIEKNRTIGGGLQCFERGGTLFDTGMHILGGFHEGGNLYKICRYLGILDNLRIKHTDADAMDAVEYGDDGRQYRLPRGKRQFADYLKQMFPAESEGIDRYMDALYALTNEVDLFYLRAGANNIFAHGDEFVMPADEFIAKYVGDERLRDLLAYMNPMYGGVAGHTPAYIHAMINALYINGSSLFVGGSQQLADQLAGVITANGGEIVAGDSVEKIVVGDRMVERVETRGHRTFTGEWYISDVHPSALFGLTGEEAFPRHYVARVKSIPNSYSAFIVYLKFKPNSQPYINHPRYFQESRGSAWSLGRFCEETFPQGFMYITPPVTDNDTWASHMIVNCLMPFEPFRKWEHTTVGRRGDDYKEWKQRLKAKVMAKLEALHPGLTEAVDYSFASTPLTIRDYYNAKEGSLYGHQFDCKSLMLSQVPIATKVRNLLLTGQNVNLHGICGVPLTAIETAEAIVGKGRILERINIANNK